MFCSNCGKSLKSEHTVCPYCGMIVGESRFDSNRGYTGAQNKLRPGQAVRVNNSYGNHYSASFSVESDKTKTELPSDEDSSYRAAKGAGVTGYGDSDDREPLFNSDEAYDEIEEAGYLDTDPEPAKEEAPKSEKRSFRSLFLKKDEPDEKKEEEEIELIEDEDYELTDEEKNAIRLEETPSAPSAGISDDVRRFMSGLREEYDRRTQEQERKAAKKQAKKQAAEKLNEDMGFDAYGEDDAPKKQKKARKSKKKEEDFDIDLDEETEEDDEDDFDETEEKPKKKDKPSRKQMRVAKEFFRKNKPNEDFEDFDPEEADEADAVDDEIENSEFADEYDDESIDEELRRANRLKVLRMILAVAAAVLLIIGGIVLFRTIRNKQEKTAPVPDVSLALWNEGTQLMQQRVGADYISEKMSLYDASNPMGAWPLFSDSFTKDLDGLNQLLPAKENQKLNDQLFVDALRAIQTNINNCLSNDYLAMMDSETGEAQKKTASEQRWKVVQAQVTMLVNAQTKGELERVKKYTTVDFTQDKDEPEADATPVPVTYTSLQSGSKGEEVIKLQTRLINLGYLSDSADGSFGPKTKTAVQLFQQTIGLKATGIADEETQRRLYADDAPMNAK